MFPPSISIGLTLTKLHREKIASEISYRHTSRQEIGGHRTLTKLHREKIASEISYRPTSRQEIGGHYS